MKEKITKDLTISEIFSRYPQHSQKLAQVMTQAGLHCVSCSSSTFETIEGGMLGHGMNLKEIEELLEKLNGILAEEMNPQTITITPAAAKKFKEIAAQEGNPQAALRFGVSAGGCSGFEYLLDFSDGAEEDDQIFSGGELEIHVKKSLLNKVMGSSIDYVEGLYGTGFKISNPNAKSSCGCGKSQNF